MQHLAYDNLIKDMCEREIQQLTNNPSYHPQCQSPGKNSSSNSGRWTREEHLRFVEGLSLYGKNWKKVEGYVGSRTGAQIRSHAQKFFNRLEREYARKQISQKNEGNKVDNEKILQEGLDNIKSTRKQSGEYSIDKNFSEDEESDPKEETLQAVSTGVQNKEENVEAAKNNQDAAKISSIEQQLQKVKGMIQILSAYEHLQTEDKQTKDTITNKDNTSEEKVSTKNTISANMEDENENSQPSNSEESLKQKSLIPKIDSMQLGETEKGSQQNPEEQQQPTKTQGPPVIQSLDISPQEFYKQPPQLQQPPKKVSLPPQESQQVIQQTQQIETSERHLQFNSQPPQIKELFQNEETQIIQEPEQPEQTEQIQQQSELPQQQQQNNQQSADTQQKIEIEEQKPISQDSSFFQFILNKYGRYVNVNYNQQPKLSELVDMSTNQSTNSLLSNQHEIPFDKQKRKSSFLLFSDGINSAQNQEKLQNLRKKVKVSDDLSIDVSMKRVSFVKDRKFTI